MTATLAVSRPSVPAPAPAASLVYRPGDPVLPEDLVFLVGQPTPYGMLEHLSAEWVQAVRDTGRRACIVRTAGGGGLERLQSLLSAGRPRAFVAFSGVNWDLLAGDRLLFDAIDVPYVGLMFDDPAYFPQRHRLASRNLALLFTDDDHYEASRALSPGTAPRGRFRFGVRPPLTTPVDHAQRTIPLLFAKTPGDPAAERRSWDELDPAMRTILNDVADVALWQDARGLWSIVRERLAADGLTDGLDTTIGMATIVARVDHYVRLARALRVVQALAPHDAWIVGSGWRSFLPAASRARVVDDCDMGTLLALLDDSRVSINVQPNNRYAPHERLLFGMQRGCCVLSDAAPPVRAAVGAENIQPFSWHEELGDVIAELLSTPQRARDIALRAAPHACAEWSTATSASRLVRTIDVLASVLGTTSPLTLPAALSS